MSRRARDLGLLTQEGVIDMVQMAHAMQQRDRQRATCVLEAMYADSAVTARLYDSVLLHATGKVQDTLHTHKHTYTHMSIFPNAPSKIRACDSCIHVMAAAESNLPVYLCVDVYVCVCVCGAGWL